MRKCCKGMWLNGTEYKSWNEKVKALVKEDKRRVDVEFGTSVKSEGMNCGVVKLVKHSTLRWHGRR